MPNKTHTPSRSYGVYLVLLATFAAITLGSIAMRSVPRAGAAPTVLIRATPQKPGLSVTRAGTLSTPDGERVRYALSWSMPTQGPKNHPSVGYELEILRQGTPILQRFHAATVTTDTFTLPLPALDSVAGPYAARIRTRDQKGQVSAWTTTPEWSLTNTSDVPLPPQNFKLEQLEAMASDGLVGIVLRPDTLVAVIGGDPVEFCTILIFDDGRTMLIPIREDSTNFCTREYLAWKGE